MHVSGKFGLTFVHVSVKLGSALMHALATFGLAFIYVYVLCVCYRDIDNFSVKDSKVIFNFKCSSALAPHNCEQS